MNSAFKPSYVLFGLLTAACLWGCEGQISLEEAADSGAPDVSDDPDPPDTSTPPAPDASAPDLGVADMSGDMDVPPDPAPEADPNPNTIPQDNLFTCQDPTAPRSSPVRLRRLNRIEWTRNAGQSRSSGMARNPLDPNPALHYSTYSNDTSIDTATLDQYLNVNNLPGGSWTASYGNPRLDVVRSLPELRCFWNDSDPDEACTRTFIATMLERGIYFRPPTTEEVDALMGLANSALSSETAEGPTREDTVVKISRAAWMTGGALFRSEVGQEPGADGRRKLSDWEIAHALSYAISDRAPGAPIYIWYDSNPEGFLPDIREAALDGTISDPAVIASLARTYLSGVDPGTLGPTEDPDDEPAGLDAKGRSDRVGRRDLLQDYRDGDRARRGEYWVSDKVRSFFREWLDYEDVASVFKDRPEATSRFDSGGTSIYRDEVSAYNNALGGFYGEEAIMIDLLDDIIARVVFEDSDVLAELLTTRQYYLPSSVSNPFGGAEVSGYMYNVDSRSNPVEDNRAARWTTLPSTERAGVLTHPAWLAAHGGNFENDPSAIHRGLWVREELLCGVVPDVPITVDAQLDPETVTESARARVDLKTGAPECAGCHTLMNPLGYPFEIYNHAGYLREEDHGGPPDGSAVLVSMPDPMLEGPVTDAVDMMERFAGSRHVKRCFVRQSFRYFMGRDETVADACTLADMEQSYDASGGSMIEMLVTLFTSDTFLYRHVPTEEAP